MDYRNYLLVWQTFHSINSHKSIAFQFEIHPLYLCNKEPSPVSQDLAQWWTFSCDLNQMEECARLHIHEAHILQNQFLKLCKICPIEFRHMKTFIKKDISKINTNSEPSKQKWNKAWPYQQWQQNYGPCLPGKDTRILCKDLLSKRHPYLYAASTSASSSGLSAS